MAGTTTTTDNNNSNNCNNCNNRKNRKNNKKNIIISQQTWETGDVTNGPQKTGLPLDSKEVRLHSSLPPGKNTDGPTFLPWAPRCSIRRRNLAAGEGERCSEVSIYIYMCVYLYIYIHIYMRKRIILPNIAVRCPKFQGLRIGVLGVDPLVIKPLENHTSSRSGCAASGEFRPDWSWRDRLV